MAQEFAANGYALRYFDKSKYGEVDFVVPGDGKAVPIEVKAGSDYRKHKSLDNVMAVGEWGIDHALVFCPGNVQCAGPVTYLPWYLLMFCSPETGGPLLVSW